MLDNVNPNLWGKYCWKFLHYYASAYPDNPTEEDKNNAIQFLNALQKVLPCETCRYHFANNLKLNNNILANKKNMINWVKDVHNEVNYRNKKKLYSYEEVIEEYSHNPKNKSILYINIALALLIIVIICFYVFIIK